MPNYDFKTLSPVDFEILSRDLLQEEHQLTLQSFTSGRDGGIDFRYSRDASGTFVVQCKHYVESGYDSLLHVLVHKELPKLNMLKPRRYLLTTSVPLTPKRKDDIVAALAPHFRSADDVYGKDDLNNLLGRFETIERKTIKLWLFSLPLLEEILHAAVRNISKAELERIRESAKLYVQNESFDQAVGILDNHNFCIIAGMPGIGKTILAEMLVLHYSRAGYEVIKVSNDIAEAWDLKGVGAKRLFYYDDFLGQSSLTEKLRKNEDQRIIDFIHAIGKTPLAKLIMTTREYVLQQAYQEYEKLNREGFADQKCIVDLSKYTRMNRARILFNHIYFSALPPHFRAEILADRAYLRIIDHRNFSPRIVQLLTEYARLRNITLSNYVPFFIKSLDNPLAIWEQAFTKHISQAARNLLVLFATLPHQCFMQDMETAYHTYNLTYARAFAASISPQDFRSALKELDGDFLKYETQELGVLVSFTNPSSADFVRQYIESNPIELKLLLQSMAFFEQLYVLWSWPGARPVVNRSIQEDPVLFEEISRRLLTASACRVITVRHGKTERKEHWPHSLEERLALLMEMAPQTTDRLLTIVQKGACDIERRIQSGEYDRHGLANLIDALVAFDTEHSRTWIAPLVATYIDALIDGPRWIYDLQPLCRLVEKKPDLFSEATLSRVAVAVEKVAESVLEDDYDLDSESLREEAEVLESLSKIVSASVAYTVAALRERANERDKRPSEDDDDRIEYSSSSSSDESTATDEDIDSMFSTLSLQT
ncbi:MAG: hypothetical protein GTO45_19450 [Candidatus Aminicenantes bacterium]|nr:hypothetical protein [Candidatus Aminicenantes bacterium]NIM80967.1 hypothetical protein [Candidatus Aminicenantes bacterium]NIN20349.1 hypothetical protein [Candidatus Aminicenantes bacterium]NIN44124.1 hypothetical protein [Candidatus Aminicenantes bacterium]NIN86937.1 hypothetical protein [Candidatus Aminicenantes bacterium]